MEQGPIATSRRSSSPDRIWRTWWRWLSIMPGHVGRAEVPIRQQLGRGSGSCLYREGAHDRIQNCHLELPCCA